MYDSSGIKRILAQTTWKEIVESPNFVSRLQTKFVANGIKANQMEFMMTDLQNAGEMAHQQFFYSSFSMLFASAALKPGKKFLPLGYRADEEVTSSIPCMWRDDEDHDFEKGHITISQILPQF